jgi:hypothetical protein
MNSTRRCTEAGCGGEVVEVGGRTATDDDRTDVFGEAAIVAEVTDLECEECGERFTR